MLLLNLILLIEVTFSTPTLDYAQNPINERNGLVSAVTANTVKSPAASVKHFAHKLAMLLLLGFFLFARAAPSSTDTKSGGHGVIRLQVKPCCPHVLKEDRVQFAVWLLGKTLAADWSVSGPGCTGAACGTVSSDGVYTAPATIPKPPTVRVKATITSERVKATLPPDVNHDDSATVTICSCESQPTVGKQCWSACALPYPSNQKR